MVSNTTSDCVHCFCHTNENVLDIILVDCDGSSVHEVQQQAQSLGVKVLEDHSAAVLLQEPRLEHPVEVWRAGAQHQLVRGEVPPVRHQHRVREPALHQIFFCLLSNIFCEQYLSPHQVEL